VEATPLVDQVAKGETRMIDVKPDWWQTFFSGLFLDFWEAVPSADQDRAEADYLQKALDVTPPAKLLDVPCGNGRLVLELASRGYRVTGVDLADYVARGRARAAERGLTVQLEQRDMRDLPWTSEFDGAFCMGNSFGYLDDEGSAAFFTAVCRALKPGAGFVLDYGYVAESLLPNFRDSRGSRIGQFWGMQQNEYDHASGRYRSEITVVRGTQMETKAYSARVYTYRQVCAMLAAAGFERCEGWASFSGEPYKLGAPRLLLNARKG
jgi:SAM-dependent methyltransferase